MESVTVVLESAATEPHMVCLFDHVVVPVVPMITDAITPLITTMVEQSVAAWNAFVTSPIITTLVNSVTSLAREVVEAYLFADKELKEFSSNMATTINSACQTVTGSMLEVSRHINLATSDWCSGLTNKLTLEDAALALVPTVLSYLFDLLQKHVWAPLTSRMLSVADTLGSALNQLIVGLGGLIPEIGGVSFSAVTVPLGAALGAIFPDMATTFMTNIQEGTEGLITQGATMLVKETITLVESGVDLITNPIQPAIDDAMDAGASVAATFAPVFSSLISFLLPEVSLSITACTTNLETTFDLIKQTTCAAAREAEAKAALALQ